MRHDRILMPGVRISRRRIGRASRHREYLSVCAGALARVRMDIPQLTFSLAADFRSEHGHHSNRCSPVLIDFFLPKNKVLLPDHSAHVAFAPKTENWTEVATQLQGLLIDAGAPCDARNRGITTTIFHRETRC